MPNGDLTLTAQKASSRPETISSITRLQQLLITVFTTSTLFIPALFGSHSLRLYFLTPLTRLLHPFQCVDFLCYSPLFPLPSSRQLKAHAALESSVVLLHVSNAHSVLWDLSPNQNLPSYQPAAPNMASGESLRSFPRNIRLLKSWICSGTGTVSQVIRFTGSDP